MVSLFSRRRLAPAFAGVVLLVVLLLLAVTAPAAAETAAVAAEPKAEFFEDFQEGDPLQRWRVSQSRGGRWAVETVTTYTAQAGERMLVVQDRAAHHAVVGPRFAAVGGAGGGDIVVQYEVRLQEGLDCGGAYLKLLPAAAGQKEGGDEADSSTAYTVMFGPDRCGGDTNKVHLIVRHRNPRSGAVSEHHLRSPPRIKTDRLSHLYTLHLSAADNAFRIAIDGANVSAGSLLDGDLWEPPINPAADMDDPADRKPADWVDDADMDDPAARKPADWDDDAPATIADAAAVRPSDWDEAAPETIADPEARKPLDWSDDDDGEWEAPQVANPACQQHGCGPWTPPLIRNPAYRGRWRAPRIANPAYRGPWAPRRIANPHHFVTATPLADLGAVDRVLFELWTMTPAIAFDNILVASDPRAAALHAARFAERAAVERDLFLDANPDADLSDAADGADDWDPDWDGDLADDGWVGVARHYLEQLQDMAVERPVLLVSAIAIGLSPLLLLVLCGGAGGVDADDATTGPGAKAGAKASGGDGSVVGGGDSAARRRKGATAEAASASAADKQGAPSRTKAE